jgi:hypothetical protein
MDSGGFRRASRSRDEARASVMPTPSVYMHAEAYFYVNKNLIHITELKITTARETREADIK